MESRNLPSSSSMISKKEELIWWIKKSQSIPGWLIAGPWFTFFCWWIPSAATSWYFMRSSIRNRFINSILLILVGSLSLLWLDPFMVARPAVGLGQALKNKTAIFVQKNSDEPAPRPADCYSRYSEKNQRRSICISEISVTDHKKRKDNLKKLKSLWKAIKANFS